MLNNYFLTIAFLLISISVFGQKSISIEIDFSKGYSLRKDIYGVNNNTLRKPYYMSNSGFQEVYEDLGKPTMRYPGGTISNYVDLSNGRSEVWPGADEKDANRAATHNNLLVKAGKEDKGEDIGEYIKFLKETEATSTFVMNITTTTDEEAESIFRKIRDQGAEIKYFEIGNELYTKQYETAIPDAADYIKKAKTRALLIKSYFPDALIGALSPSSIWSDEVFMPDGGLTGERDELWYEAIKKEDFFDAIIMHMYSTTGMNRLVSMEDWLPVEESYTYGISQIDGHANAVFKRLKDDFPGKKVWVTEYNIGGFSDSLSTYPLRNTYLGGLSTAGFMMKMIQNKNVEMSSWHSLIQMITNESSPNQLLPDDTEFGRIQNYDFFMFFKESIRQARQYKPVVIKGNKTYQGRGDYPDAYSDMDAIATYNPTTQRVFLTLINKKEQSYKLSINDLETSIGASVLKVNELTPDSQLEVENAIQTNHTELNDLNIDLESIVIKPYSLYRIELERSLTQVEEIVSNEILIFPNPTSDKLTISSNQDLRQWVVTNKLGQQVLMGEGSYMDASSLSPGMYYLQVRGQTLPFLKK